MKKKKMMIKCIFLILCHWGNTSPSLEYDDDDDDDDEEFSLCISVISLVLFVLPKYC